jgi:hypothetical protein
VRVKRRAPWRKGRCRYLPAAPEKGRCRFAAQRVRAGATVRCDTTGFHAGSSSSIWLPLGARSAATIRRRGPHAAPVAPRRCTWTGCGVPGPRHLPMALPIILAGAGNVLDRLRNSALAAGDGWQLGDHAQRIAHRASRHQRCSLGRGSSRGHVLGPSPCSRTGRRAARALCSRRLGVRRSRLSSLGTGPLHLEQGLLSGC